MDQQPTNYTVETPNAPQNDGNKGLAIATLITGIASLVFCCYGVGIVCAIVSLVLGKKYNAQATAENKMVKIGKILAIIGLVISIIGTIVSISLCACAGCAAAAGEAYNYAY